MLPYGVRGNIPTFFDESQFNGATDLHDASSFRKGPFRTGTLISWRGSHGLAVPWACVGMESLDSTRAVAMVPMVPDFSVVEFLAHPNIFQSSRLALLLPGWDGLGCC